MILTESSKIRNRTIRDGAFASAMPPSMRPITNWDRLDGLPEKITREEFERGYAERSRLSLDEFHRYLKAVSCECGEEDCEGWQAISMRTWKREQREARRRELLARTHTVYFAELGGLIKIGISDNPERRARDLNALLLGTCVGSRSLEKELHREFADLCERGEWFRAEPRLLRRIEELVAS